MALYINEPISKPKESKWSFFAFVIFTMFAFVAKVRHFNNVRKEFLHRVDEKSMTPCSFLPLNFAQLQFLLYQTIWQKVTIRQF